MREWLMGAVLLLACGSQQAVESTVVTQSEAERIASESGAEHGYDMNVFELRNSRQHDDGSWWVHFEHAPPTPPGGHFAVEVDAEGNARLMHGE